MMDSRCPACLTCRQPTRLSLTLNMPHTRISHPPNSRLDHTASIKPLILPLPGRHKPFVGQQRLPSTTSSSCSVPAYCVLEIHHSRLNSPATASPHSHLPLRYLRLSHRLWVRKSGRESAKHRFCARPIGNHIRSVYWTCISSKTYLFLR